MPCRQPTTRGRARLELPGGHVCDGDESPSDSLAGGERIAPDNRYQVAAEPQRGEPVHHRPRRGDGALEVCGVEFARPRRN